MGGAGTCMEQRNKIGTAIKPDPDRKWEGLALTSRGLRLGQTLNRTPTGSGTCMEKRNKIRTHIKPDPDRKWEGLALTSRGIRLGQTFKPDPLTESGRCWHLHGAEE